MPSIACLKNIEDQYIIINHSDREALALELKEKIEETVKCKKVFISDVFASCGTNIGPGMIGAYFLGAPVSDDSQYEKDALNKVIEEI